MNKEKLKQHIQKLKGSKSIKRIYYLKGKKVEIDILVDRHSEPILTTTRIIGG